MLTEGDVRRVALSLPHTTEKPSYGTLGFRVKDRLFARIREEGEVLVVWCSDLGELRELLTSWRIGAPKRAREAFDAAQAE